MLILHGTVSSLSICTVVTDPSDNIMKVEITIILKVKGIVKLFMFHAVTQVSIYIPTTALCREI